MFKKLFKAVKTISKAVDFIDLVDETIDKKLDEKYNKIELIDTYLLKQNLLVKNNLGFIILDCDIYLIY